MTCASSAAKIFSGASLTAAVTAFNGPGLEPSPHSFILREEILKPVLAAVARPKRGRPPKNVHTLDLHYQTLPRQMLSILQYLTHAA